MIAMFRVARAELRRFTSRSYLLPALALPAFFAALTTVFTFSNATTGPAATGPASGPPGSQALTVAELAGRTGYLRGVTQSFTFLGVIVIVLAAMSVATDYSQGTIRNLLVRQPSRWRLLGGKLMALAVLVTGSATAASVSATIAARMVASGNGVSTAAWSLAPLPGHIGALALGLFGWAAIGALLATITRSVPAATGIGIGWALPVETVIGAFWKSGKKWFPGGIFEAIASLGTPTVGLGRASVTGLIYLALAIGVAITLFTRREVTA